MVLALMMQSKDPPSLKPQENLGNGSLLRNLMYDLYDNFSFINIHMDKLSRFIKLSVFCGYVSHDPSKHAETLFSFSCCHK